jgi:hypothetical protein
MKIDLKYWTLACVAIGFFLGTLIKIQPAHAVTFSVDLTTAEVSTATWKWNSEDPSHVKWVTVNLYGQDAVKRLVAEWENQRIAAFSNQTAKCQMWNFLTVTEKNSICTTINEAAGCTIPGC